MPLSFRIILAAVLFASGLARADLSTLISASTEGDPAAQAELASKHENSEGVVRDYALALELYCRAAKQGHAQAQFRLGWMYANARGVTKDDALAAYWFNLAAAQGHEYAQRMLQYMPPVSKTPSCLLEPLVEQNVLLAEHDPAEMLDLDWSSP